LSGQAAVSPELAPEEALRALAAELRRDGSVISPHVAEPAEEPALGLLAAAGPRAAGAPGAYALVIESVREGYLLHYGEARVVAGADPDLALLAGDYLYALGLRRLAAMGDLEAVRELSDLISLCSQLHAPGGDAPAAPGLWLASTLAVATGAPEGHDEAKRALREDRPDAGELLAASAREAAAGAGLDAALRRASDSIGFRPVGAA
jgi:hypothetical protein